MKKILILANNQANLERMKAKISDLEECEVLEIGDVVNVQSQNFKYATISYRRDDYEKSIAYDQDFNLVYIYAPLIWDDEDVQKIFCTRIKNFADELFIKIDRKAIASSKDNFN